MKKFALFLITFVLLGFSTSYAAENYAVVYSDINVCINHYNIPSFAINGTSAVVLEDLEAYGIKVDTYSKPGAVTLSVNRGARVNPIKFELDALQTGLVAGYAVKNVVPVYINNIKIDSYYFNGYTFIPAESLGHIGEVYWFANDKTLKVWLDGVAIKDKYEPAPYSYASTVYKQVMQDLQVYRAAGNYETAVSALNWTINTLGENSPYYDALFDIREEYAYLNAVKNIAICVKGNNLKNAISEAYIGLNYCSWGSAYFKLLAEQYCELKYKDASNNMSVHLKNRDYYSAYLTASWAWDAIYEFAYEGFENCDYYNECIENDVAAICEAWKRYSGQSFIIAEHYGNDGKIDVRVINLENKTVRAFKFTANVCDVFGDAIYGNHTFRAEDLIMTPYSYKTYTWNFSHSRVELLTNIKLLQVVYK